MFSILVKSSRRLLHSSTSRFTGLSFTSRTTHPKKPQGVKEKKYSRANSKVVQRMQKFVEQKQRNKVLLSTVLYRDFLEKFDRVMHKSLNYPSRDDLIRDLKSKGYNFE